MQLFFLNFFEIFNCFLIHDNLTLTFCEICNFGESRSRNRVPVIVKEATARVASFSGEI